MRWKLKATIQNAISLLPPSASYDLYYWMQRHFGGLKKINPVARLLGAVGIWKLIKQLGYDPKEKVFFEIGTGRVPMVPLAFWLMGGGKTITVDLNPYLKADLTKECIEYIVDNKNEILTIFGELIDQNRLADLISFNNNVPFSMSALLELCCIEYLAPADAAHLTLASDSIDFYTSYNVFEHIPSDILQKILNESVRIIKDTGLFIHRIDYSDHFAHDDKSISRINFLQYSDNEWNKYAGNGYMYMNRMRHDDFMGLFKTLDFQLVAEIPDVDQAILELLKSDRFLLDGRFKVKSLDVLATHGAWIALKAN